MAEHDSGLARKSATAFLWGAGGAFGKIALQIVAQVVLARLVGPAEYGLFALGVLVLGLCSYFADIGVAYGLIQKTEVTDDDLRFVWTWQLALGSCVAAGLFFGAGAISNLFAKPEALFVFQWLAAVCLMNGLAAVSTNLLRKALDYRWLQIAQLAGYFAGFVCVGIPLAALGWGAGALVSAWLVQAALTLVLLYARARHPVSLLPWLPGSAGMLKYGLTVLSTNLVNWVLTAFDKFIVGRVYPASVVGLYTNAFNLVNSPAAALYGNLQSVVLSAGARLQGDSAALREAYLGLLAGIALVAFPFFVSIGLGAEFVVLALYGEAWSGAAPFLTAFSIVMPCLLLWGASTPMLWNSGRTRLELWLQLPLTVVWIVALSAAAAHSVLALAVVASVLYALRCVVVVLAVMRVIAVPARAVLRALRGGALVTLALGLAVAVAMDPIARQIASPQVRLCLLVVVAGCTYVTLVVACAPIVVDRRLATGLRDVSDRSPAAVRTVVRWVLRREAGR